MSPLSSLHSSSSSLSSSSSSGSSSNLSSSSNLGGHEYSLGSKETKQSKQISDQFANGVDLLRSSSFSIYKNLSGTKKKLKNYDKSMLIINNEIQSLLGELDVKSKSLVDEMGGLLREMAKIKEKHIVAVDKTKLTFDIPVEDQEKLDAHEKKYIELTNAAMQNIRIPIAKEIASLEKQLYQVRLKKLVDGVYGGVIPKNHEDENLPALNITYKRAQKPLEDIEKESLERLMLINNATLDKKAIAGQVDGLIVDKFASEDASKQSSPQKNSFRKAALSSGVQPKAQFLRQEAGRANMSSSADSVFDKAAKSSFGENENLNQVQQEKTSSASFRTARPSTLDNEVSIQENRRRAQSEFLRG